MVKSRSLYGGCRWAVRLPHAAAAAVAVPLTLGRASRSSAAHTNAAIAAAACGDSLTARLGYVQRCVALGDITNRPPPCAHGPPALC
eukprot:Transcript_27781.p8 GENE.Transcript_27781~~Transcript_27781.p8  ORF type:complete len:87 (+),score=9.87 Transcript_27781:1149-1409(+)